MGDRPAGRRWMLLSSHGQTLVFIAQQPGLTLAQLASKVGLTERRTHAIVRDLAEAGYVTVTRQGRRNSYTVNGDRPFRHQLLAHHEVRDLLAVLR
jgi:DNA-binding MarR family transcriptional regulator